MNEIWKTIKGFEDYEISSLGRVKSLKFGKEKIMIKSVNRQGYLHVRLCNKNKCETKKIHKLVSIAFLNHTPNGNKIVVNHKDFNRKNNHIDNLEIVTQRENCNKKHLKSSSVYTGVCWCTRDRKWMAYITINGKGIFLGLFKNELDASNAYQNKLSQLNNK